MLSFKVIGEEFNKDIEAMLSDLSTDERENAKEIICDYGTFSSEGEMEFGVCISGRCLCTRVFDYGRYYFLAPAKLCDGADLKQAYLDILEYAKREELPFNIHEVPAEHFSTLLGFIRHVDVDAEGTDGESFHLNIKNECQLLDEIPEFENDELLIRGLCGDDALPYARLCRDKKVNKNFGYSPADDHPDATDEELLELALTEFDRGLCISLALEYSNEFVGDALFYAFDGMGGAEIAMRILPERQGRGLGALFLENLFEYAASIGLLRVGAFVKKENVASVVMCSKFMEKISEDGDRVFFSKDLTP